MDGLIILDKPIGISSAKALYRVRRVTGQRKSGHGGTLDPSASGVLILCLGKATKLTELIMDHPKVYRATARFDLISESHDSEQSTTEIEVSKVPSAERVVEAKRLFEGVIKQKPPMLSAVKIGGMASYARARAGSGIEPTPRSVRIDWIHVHRFDWPEVDFEMCCGRGTYVRSLIRDWGEALSVGGCLTSLVRSRIGPFLADEAQTFESLEQASSSEEYLIELEKAKALLDPGSVVIPPRPA